MTAVLTCEQREGALAGLADWVYDPERQALHRKIRLGDFSETFALMTRVAMLAEVADHHPEWSNVYNRLEIWLTTHDAGGVSSRDLDMAQAIDRLLR